MTLADALPIIVPLLVLQVLLIVLALRDLMRPERRVRGGSKVAWAVVIIAGELLGPLLYLFVGRIEQ
jgi:hypothetical protein